jgi:hypothetical protein
VAQTPPQDGRAFAVCIGQPNLAAALPYDPAGAQVFSTQRNEALGPTGIPAQLF